MQEGYAVVMMDEVLEEPGRSFFLWLWSAFGGGEVVEEGWRRLSGCRFTSVEVLVWLRVALGL